MESINMTMTDDAIFLINIGEKIKEVRQSKQMTQHRLARLCNFEKASMSRIEAGKRNVTLLTLKKISDALNADIVQFFTN
jgi:transcriptional regulator with XRE-family HTH domain